MTQTNTTQVAKTKISLPDYVYRNLDDFGNSALPNSCNEFTKEELGEYLTKKMGRPIKVRLADFVKVESTAGKLEVNQHYYIAEEIRTDGKPKNTLIR